MAKKNTTYYCTACGYESSGWLGKCPSCGGWNTFEEKINIPKAKSGSGAGVGQGWLGDLLDEDSAKEETLLTLDKVHGEAASYFSSGINEFDRVLGGGFVPGSLVLVGGDPGIGKSTLLLQASAHAKTTGPILYICGEESPQQVKLRSDRLQIKDSGIKLTTEVVFEKLAVIISKLKPRLVVADSIQTLYSDQTGSAPGTPNQIRDVAAGFLRLAKKLGTTIILVGHVTKTGNLAGPRMLEHMVDTVLYFEGDKYSSLRLVRAVKNRFGPTNEVALFEMGERGLMPVENPSEALLESMPQQVPGSALSVIVEGTRPLVVEIQALLNATSYPSPLRMAQGLDRNRVSMLMALLEKQTDMTLSNMDSFINVVSGLQADDPATDLALLAAITSSYKNLPIRAKTLFCGEVGLTGEIRPVSRLADRLKEASNLNFEYIFLPGSAKREIQKLDLGTGLEVIFVDQVQEALDICF